MRLSLNKNALKQQRDHLAMYRRFLPSLDLKRKQLLKAQKEAQLQLAELQADIERFEQSAQRLLPTLGSSTIDPSQLNGLVRVEKVVLAEENVVGIHLPAIREIDVVRAEYSRLTLPFWVDQLGDYLEQIARLRIQLQVRKARVDRLVAAARKITQRVNLFEKILIPRAESNIKQIGIALADQERAAVVRSKIAKRKRQTS
jgi:V/A-type H+-transporting ATPase subunit D